MGEDGVITVTLNNLSMEEPENVEVLLTGEGFHVKESKIVTGSDVHDFNDFDAPEKVTEQDFGGYKETARGLDLALPAGSVVEIRLVK